MCATYYWENPYLLRYRYEYTCESAIYYCLHAQATTLQHNVSHVIDNEPISMIFDAGEHLLLLNLLRPRALVCEPENRPFLFPYAWVLLLYTMINKTELCKCSLSLIPFCLAQKMLTWTDTNPESDRVFQTLFYSIKEQDNRKYITWFTELCTSLWPPWFINCKSSKRVMHFKERTSTNKKPFKVGFRQHC